MPSALVIYHFQRIPVPSLGLLLKGLLHATTVFWVLREFVSIAVGLFAHFTSVPKSIPI